MTPPTKEQLFEEELEEVLDSVHTGWRHGATHITTYHRFEDNTYWEAVYRVSTDGETHELRDEDYGMCRIYQVEPYEETVTRYRKKV